ncbi:MAG: hypothetical protein Q9227_006569 [Pyrenula ochraceoflavens]
MVNHRLIEDAFAPEQVLKKRVFDAISSTPKHTALFEDIARYALSLQSGSEEPAAKKRKTEQNGDTSTVNPPQGVKRPIDDTYIKKGGLMFDMPDISFILPVRKKLKLQVWSLGIHAKDAKTDELQWYMDRERARDTFRLPLPEKAQKQSMFVILPAGADGLRKVPIVEGQSPAEAAIFTLNEFPSDAKAQALGKYRQPALVNSIDKHNQIGDDIGMDYEEGRKVEATLKYWFTMLGDEVSELTEPFDREFTSTLPDPLRKGEKLFYVKCYRGTKDGFLWPLPNGLLFTPKKPILFFRFDDITSIHYSNIVQRTFSLNITTKVSKPHSNGTGPTGGQEAEEEEEEEAEWEFSHIDQSEFAGIDAYVKKHQLHDASLAESRRAKASRLEKRKAAAISKGTWVRGDVIIDEEEGEEEEEELTELAKAERELQDVEDEGEEDYDPESEGESEGSGSSDGEGGGDQGGEGEKDIVAEELGSEAEDVQMSDEEEEEAAEEEEQPDVEDPNQL